MNPSRTLRLLAVLLILISTAGCDQVTKQFARSELSELRSTALPGGFLEFALAENPGAFLSLGASLPQPLRGGFLTIGIGLGLTMLLIYLLRAANLRWLSFLGLVLIWSGGMSNLIDRFARHGRVTDFILLRIGPLHTGVFNFADMAIMAGVVILVASFRARSSPSELRSKPSE
jgi:signal peptidase II